MIRSCILICSIVSMLYSSGQKINIAEKLGYPKDSKLLILHADDLGVSHSENTASIEALENNPVNSASIMVPCPWFPEIAQYARQNQNSDLGLHLTLNSEWDYFKWGPVSARDSVSTLVNKQGYFYASIDSVVQLASATQVKIEMRNQIRKAFQAGINVTHLDAHMGTAVASADFAKAYIELGKEFDLPVLLDERIHQYEIPGLKELLDDRTVLVDNIVSASPEDFNTNMAAFYTETLKDLEPGLTVLLIHLAYDDKEMRAITVNHPNWGAAWRQADVDFFNSAECSKILEEEGIILVTWREIRDRITRAP